MLEGFFAKEVKWRDEIAIAGFQSGSSSERLPRKFLIIATGMTSLEPGI
jgi:hypothetical protein